MNYYTIALFIHIVGAVGVFVALGLEWTGLRQMKSAATAEQVRDWMRIAIGTRRLGMVSMLTLLVAGLYMMATAWGAVAWIVVAFSALVLLVVLAMVLTGPRMAAVGRALAAEKGPVSHTLQDLINHPLLWISVQTRLAIALGIVFLMTVKPGWAGSLLTIGAAIVLGLISALPMPRRAGAQQRSAH